MINRFVEFSVMLFSSEKCIQEQVFLKMFPSTNSSSVSIIERIMPHKNKEKI